MHPRPGRGSGGAVAAAEAADAEVLVDGQSGEDLAALGHEDDALGDDGGGGEPVDAPAVELDRAGGDGAADAAEAAGDRPQQRRLAGAVAAEHGDDAVVGDIDGHARQRPHRAAVADVEISNGEHGRTMRCAGRCR